MAVLTGTAVDWFFTSSEVKRFKVPTRIKTMCMLRLNGMTYKKIAEMHNEDEAKVRENIMTVARCYERHIRFGMRKSDELSEREINYIKKHFRGDPVERIARYLMRPISVVEKEVSELMAKGIISNYTRELNPNPVTGTTRMLVCRYYEDNTNKGMTEKAAIYNIACDLNREPEVISKVLEECKKDGTYEFYNEYGTELRMGGVEW